MDTRVAMISIVVENQGDIEKLNQILHEYGSYIIGRMGLPYPKRNISLISVTAVSYTHLTLPTRK